MGLFKHAYLLLLLCSWLKAGAQYKHRVDSLENLVKKEKSDTQRVMLYQDLVYEAMNHSHLDEAEKYLKKMKTELEINPWLKGSASFHHANAMLFFFHNNYDKSLEENNKSLALWKKLGDKRGMARSYGNIALVYQVQADYATSLKYHFKGLKLEKELKSLQGIADSYNNIGIVYENTYELEKARWYQMKSITIRKKLKDNVGIQKNYSNLGNIYYTMGKMDSALYSFEKARELAEELEDDNAVAISLTNLGNIIYEQKGYRVAISMCKKAYELFKEVENTRGWIAASGNLGENYLGLKMLDSALFYSELAVNSAREIGTMDLEMTCIGTLLKVKQEMGQWKEAFEWSQRYNVLQDSILGDERKSEMARLEVEHEYEIKEEKRKIEARLDKRRQNIILYSVITGLIASLVFVVVIWKSLRANKKKNRIIQEQKQLVEAKQKEVLDSIYYAGRIQKAILPSEKIMDKNLKRMKD